MAFISKAFFLFFFIFMIPNFGLGQATFTDATTQYGIDHKHNGFFYGGGIACGDFNNDGYLDLFITDGKDYPNLLYINNQNGTFTETANSAGLADTFEGFGTVCGDLDNDGDLDIYVANYFSANRLYLNDGNANFTDVTDAAGVGDVGPSTSVALTDYDNDGYLDIYVLNRSQAVDDYACRLYRNNNDGTFTDVTQQANVGFVGTSLGVGFFDFDNDRDSDIYVADEFGWDALYRNNGDGTYTDIAKDINLPIGGGMGIDFTDYDNDGDLDIYVGNFTEDFLLKNNGDGTFTDVAPNVGIINNGIAWGINFFDCDNDGDKDVYVINGEMHLPYKAKPNRFYLNRGNGTFTEKASDFGIADEGDGRGSVCADFNNDGYLDIFLVNVLVGKSVLYLNNGGNNNWITLRLEGTVSNRSAVGARVEVVIGNFKQIGEVRAGSSYASMHPLDLSFGLKQRQLVDKITIYWPSGIVQELTSLEVNKIHTIKEPRNVTSVSDSENESQGQTNDFDLLQNFPNPFNPTTKIEYELPGGGFATLQIINFSGQEIRTFDLGFNEKGRYEIEWNGTDKNGFRVSSGVYLYRIIHKSTDGLTSIDAKKMILIK